LPALPGRYRPPPPKSRRPHFHHPARGLPHDPRAEEQGYRSRTHPSSLVSESVRLPDSETARVSPDQANWSVAPLKARSGIRDRRVVHSRSSLLSECEERNGPGRRFPGIGGNDIQKRRLPIFYRRPGATTSRL